MELYIVSKSDPSSYYVVAIYDEEHIEDARKTAEVVGGQIEHRTINSFNFQQPPRPEYWHVIMDRDGVLRDCTYKEQGTVNEFTGDLLRQCWYSYDFSVGWSLTVCVYANNEEHAIAIAEEIRLQVLDGTKPASGDIPLTEENQNVTS